MRYQNTWTQDEGHKLLEVVNRNLYPSGQVMWLTVRKGIGPHSLGSCQTHWNRTVKQWCNWNGYKWVLKQQNLFDGVTPQPKKDIAKKTPENASTRKRVKESRGLKIKKSFLWGALVIEQYN